LDTNIVLDLLGERIPFYDAASKIATLADRGDILIVVSGLSYATIFYVLSKFEPQNVVKEKLRKLKVISLIANLSDKVVEKALASAFKDFEDALQYYSALQSNCTHLITRNEKDFKLSDLPVMTALEYLES